MNKLVYPIAGVLAIAAAGCNTVEGAGQDIEAAGRGVEHASQEVAEEIDDEFNND